jgi:hypothetical protein
VTGAWVIIGLLVLGAPLLAWWIGGRRVWARLDARAADNPWTDAVRRHRLTPGESAQVTEAVGHGRALQDPRLRAAAVELAEFTLGQLSPSWSRMSIGRRVLVTLTAVWLVLVVAGAVFAIAFRSLGDVPWVLLVGLLAGSGVSFWQRRKLRKAVALNSGPAVPAEEEPA